jgi:hypothetical protein
MPMLPVCMTQLSKCKGVRVMHLFEKLIVSLHLSVNRSKEIIEFTRDRQFVRHIVENASQSDPEL